MRYSLVYGGIAGTIIIAIACAVLAMDLPGHFETPWFGYLVMLVALSLIFVGVKRYRDVECGGVIRFGRAFALGLGMAVVAGVVYVAVWEAYVAATGWDFMAEYAGSTLEGMRADGASPTAIAAKEEEMRGFEQIFANPLLRIPAIFAEIFPV